MVRPYFSAGRLWFAGKPYALMLALGLCACILAANPSSTHERGNAQAPPAALKVSIACDVDRGCGGGVSSHVIRQDAEAQLRGAGVTVSNIHNAELAIDVYCAAISPGSRGSAVVIRQCLNFSELTPSTHGGATFTSSWRKCESFTCRGAKCESLSRSGLHALVDTFLKDTQERFQPTLQRIVLPVEAPHPVDGRIAFYSLYIMTCVTVLVYWQCRYLRHRL